MDFSFAERLQTLAIQLPPFFIAIVFHEFAHGFIASRWGDPTAKMSGRLTLNPIAHVDPIGTLALPIFSMLSGIPILFGWAKPVPINPTRFRKYRPGLFWVAAAGPGMNFLLGFLSAILWVFLNFYVSDSFYLAEPIRYMAQVSIGLNFALGMFNLIPLPPLDGSKIIESMLSYNATRKYESFAQYSFWILMGLIMTGAIRILMIPVLFMHDAAVRFAVFLLGVGPSP